MLHRKELMCAARSPPVPGLREQPAHPVRFRQVENGFPPNLALLPGTASAVSLPGFPAL